MERSTVLSMLEYHMAHAPFSLKQVQGMDGLRSRYLKRCLKFGTTSATDVLYIGMTLDVVCRA